MLTKFTKAVKQITLGQDLDIVFTYRDRKINGIPILPVSKGQFGGTCACHASVNCMEAIYRIYNARKMVPANFPSLSIQHHIDLVSMQPDRYESTPQKINFLRDRGVTTEHSYPYEGPARTEDRCPSDADIFHIRGWDQIYRKMIDDGVYSYENLHTWLDKVGPFMGSFSVTDSFFSDKVFCSGHFRGEGVLKIDQNGNEEKQLVAITGYGELDGEPVWEFLNSYGPDWGMKGGFGTIPKNLVEVYSLPYIYTQQSFPELFEPELR